MEAALGIHHAAGSRKNFLLMSGSFAFSIILFLSFSPALDFMEHGIKPLRPSAPDLTISSVDNTCSVPRELADVLREDPAVTMDAAEAFSYVAGGMAAGCAAGLLLNWKIYDLLVTSRWGDPWKVPVEALGVILAVMVLSAIAAVAGPARRIREMSVVDTIGSM